MSYANRGMGLEADIERVLDNGLCLIHKIPTEIKMIRGAGGRIVKAFPVSKSKFVDFIGILSVDGSAIAIEAKETKVETRFDIKNIQPEQIDFLDKWCLFGGKGFYVVRFTTLKETFIVRARDMNDKIKVQLENDIKSIKHEWFLSHAIKLDYDLKDLYEYLTILS